MGRSFRDYFQRLVFALQVVIACLLAGFAHSQGLQTSPPNDCGCPRGDNAIPVTSGMLTPFLPKIPNLELGFQYSFGKNVRTGRFTADYVLPFKLSADSVLFGEAHAEGWDFWKKPSTSISSAPGFTTTTSTANNRIDLSFGGGYRTMLSEGTFLGGNGFYDTSRIFNKWYSSGGVGLEMAATVGGDDAVDLNVNWYGNLFNKDVLVNAFRNKGNSFDVEAGYSHALFDRALNLRLKVAGYQFDAGQRIGGWRGGADLTTRDGLFTLRYEHGSDRINGDYNTVGGFVNVGFQLENLLSGESPFSRPEPVFRSPRDLRRLLSQKVKRNWAPPTSVRLTQASPTQAQQNPCTNLTGYIAIVPAFLPTPSVTPTTPPIDLGLIAASTVTFCWCNLTSTLPTPVFDIIAYDGVPPSAIAATVQLITPSGCMTVSYVFIPTPIATAGISSTAPTPLTFGPGGGVSVSSP
jgi:hypothetical protein